MWYVCGMIRVVIDDPAVAAKLKSGGDDLKDLCRKEVERFHQYLQKFGGDYAEGLTNWEKSVVEGYLYQKIRGHIDEKIPPLKL